MNLLRGGTYRGNVRLRTGTTLKPYNGEDVTIDGVVRLEGSNPVIAGLTVKRGVHFDSDSVGGVVRHNNITNDAKAVTVRGSNPLIEGNEITNPGADVAGAGGGRITVASTLGNPSSIGMRLLNNYIHSCNEDCVQTKNIGKFTISGNCIAGKVNENLMDIKTTLPSGNGSTIAQNVFACGTGVKTGCIILHGEDRTSAEVTFSSNRLEGCAGNPKFIKLNGKPGVDNVYHIINNVFDGGPNCKVLDNATCTGCRITGNTGSSMTGDGGPPVEEGCEPPDSAGEPPPASDQNCPEHDCEAYRESLQQRIADNWIGALQLMTEDFVTMMAWQIASVGAFLDAKIQLETQADLQERIADAHRDYHPSHQMCVIGTGAQSLAASRRQSDVNAILINEILERRELLSANVVSITTDFDQGGTEDSGLAGRFEQFQTTYCDPSDNNGNLEDMCADNDNTDRYNNDIDYTKMVENRYTLDIDFTDGGDTTDDEEDIIALGRNLFSHRTFPRTPNEHLQKEYGKDDVLNMRGVHAVRSVARNSYAHLTAMRGEGAPSSGPFVRNTIAALGVPQEELAEFLGNNPSYFAQMEVLTKKIFQGPEFFSNLYDKPANVKRTGVALESIRLMNDRDRYESALRREMLISMILEMKLRELQEYENSNATLMFLEGYP